MLNRVDHAANLWRVFVNNCVSDSTKPQRPNSVSMRFSFAVIASDLRNFEPAHGWSQFLDEHTDELSSVR